MPLPLLSHHRYHSRRPPSAQALSSCTRSQSPSPLSSLSAAATTSILLSCPGWSIAALFCSTFSLLIKISLLVFIFTFLQYLLHPDGNNEEQQATSTIRGRSSIQRTLILQPPRFCKVHGFMFRRQEWFKISEGSMRKKKKYKNNKEEKKLSECTGAYPQVCAYAPVLHVAHLMKHMRTHFGAHFLQFSATLDGFLRHN
ncbi:hypothetical protein PIB30_072489 [Stylosanthes scabra]|uniref:Uncharacterized protein n=1 Tax=Stylosanthes scabra TaxID=79078 RepID=A0ABU6VMJ0_9FABA|nr:hypothetical protein [Stylosanthes scabra]